MTTSSTSSTTRPCRRSWTASTRAIAAPERSPHPGRCAAGSAATLVPGELPRLVTPTTTTPRVVRGGPLQGPAEPAAQLRELCGAADRDPLGSDEVDAAVVVGLVEPFGLALVRGEGGEDVTSASRT